MTEAKSLGTIEHAKHDKRGSVWVLRAAPHVAMKLRRLFHGSERGKGNEVIMAATDGHAYDLELMARPRYRLAIHESAAEVFPAAVERYRRRIAMVDEVLAPDYKPPTATPLALPLREYQQVAVDLLTRSGGLLLADDLGLGKTAVGIGAIVAGNALPAIVVTMTHLCRQWSRELARFAPHLNVHVVTKANPYPLRDLVMTEYDPSVKRRRIVKHGKARLPDVLVLNYHKLKAWADELLRLEVRMVVWDEAQELRRNASDRYSAARMLAEQVHVRLGLTATPIYNYGAEIYNVVDCCAPGHLGSREEFLQEWCKSTGFADKAKVVDPGALREHLTTDGVMLRRRRREVGRELPPMTRVWHEIETDADAFAKVEDAVAEIARFLLERKGTQLDRMRAAGELDWQMRQATGLAKAPAVAAFVRLLVEGDEPVVLYGWHHDVYEVWRKLLEDLNPAIYHGQVSTAGRDEAVRRFIKGETKLLIISLRAGAGLDGLQQVCRTTVFGELDWSPGVHAQCEGRIFRDGQAEPCMAYYLAATHGSDPVVRDVLGIKEEQRIGLTEEGGAEQLGATDQAGDDNRMLRLAEACLRRRGRDVPR